MADVFTQVILIEGERREGRPPRVLEGAPFQIRMEGGMFTLFSKGGDRPETQIVLNLAQVKAMSEKEVEIVGFSKSTIVDNTYAACTLVLTRPGTGWDGKEPTDD